MNNEKFSWVETHQKITEYLSTKENSQQDLIDLLKSIGIGPFNDKAGSGEHDIELNEIDPFTFFCYIYKYGSKRRLKHLQQIAEKLELDIPSGESGIPSAQAQKVWLFPYKYERVNNEVARLWDLFKKELNDQITDQDFADALQIRSVGKTKLTEALFYINPEKYLPINSPTKPYIKEELGIDPKFNTYSEYKEVLKQVRQKTDLPFYELSYEAWKWNDARKKTNYWIFQGNPKAFDIETALRDEILTDWTVSAHKNKIKVGDKVILWMTGKQSGCYALAEVTSEPHPKTASTDDHLWKGEDKSELKADIKITHNLVDRPILKESIDVLEELNGLKVGSQGTNFSATEEEYQTILELSQNNNGEKYWLYAPGENASKWEEFYEQGIMGLGWDELGDLNLLGDKEDITKAIQTTYNTESKSYNNARANLEFRDIISMGDIVIPKKGRQDYLGYGIVTSGYYYDTTRDKYQHCRKVDWKKKGVWSEPKGDIVLKTLTDITKYPAYVQRLIHLIGIEKEQNPKEMQMSFPLNTILYGPPGTGKTHRLKNEFFDKFTTKEIQISMNEFLTNKIEKLAWWEIIALALLELGKTKVPNIFNHELVQIKAENSNSTTVTPTIWGQLHSHTIDECEFVNVKKRSAIQIFNKTENSEWEILIDRVEEQIPELLKIKEEIDNFKPSKKTKKRYVFTTFHQSFSYEDFIEGIKPIIYEDEQDSEKKKQVIYEVKPGLFKEIVKDANEDRDNDYAIFIDEINRGNIANIFGELITLIEDDKRIGKDNYIPVQLPYSNEKFGVPPNLYIIGTMNTADRSVEALDTALRRRFSFIEMNPNPEILNSPEFECKDIDLAALLTAINARIEKLLDKDYCIGHSYFMTIKNHQEPLGEIKSIFQNKILPLLQEYFYGDWGKILLVIGQEFVGTKKNSVKFLSTDSYEDYEEYDEKPIYNFTSPSSWTLDSFKSIYE